MPVVLSRIRYHIMFILALSLASTYLCGQQSNPFDIIRTKSSNTPQTQNAVSITDDSTTSAIRKYEDESISGSELQDTLNLPTVVEKEDRQRIDVNNPFNIVKTNGAPAATNINPTPVIDTSDKVGSRASSSPSKKYNSWIPKLVPRKVGYKAENTFSLNFIFWIIITSLLILAVVINLKRKSFLNLYRSITNDNYLKLLQREENNGFTFFFLLLYIIFLLNAALYIYQLLINKFDTGGYKLYLSLIAAVFGIYLIRYIGLFILQITFPLEKEARQFNFTITMFNIIVGLLLIPVNILIAYAPFGSTIIYSGLGIIAIFYLLRQLRGLFIAARTKGLSYFHFFIYLCSFEVAPIFWILSFLNY